VADGVAVTEDPDPGEVVWCDDAGVTCRRWNWRQARRTQLREGTSTALFILDALDPVTGEELHAAAADLLARLARLGPDVRAHPRQGGSRLSRVPIRQLASRTSTGLGRAGARPRAAPGCGGDAMEPRR